MRPTTLRGAPVLVVLLALLPAPSAKADAPPTLTAETAYVSEYVFRGLEQQDAALQPAITFTQGDLSLGLWSSQAIKRRTQAWARGNEIDLWGTYALKLDEAATFTLGGTAYLYGTARDALGEPGHTWELSAGLTRAFGPVSLGATWFHDFKLDSDTVVVTTGRSFTLPREWGTVDLCAYYASNRIGDANGDLPGTGGFSYRYYGADLAVKHPLTPKLSAKAGLHYVAVARLTGAPANLWFHLSISRDF